MAAWDRGVEHWMSEDGPHGTGTRRRGSLGKGSAALGLHGEEKRGQEMVLDWICCNGKQGPGQRVRGTHGPHRSGRATIRLRLR
jgi:hypothetical protein